MLHGKIFLLLIIISTILITQIKAIFKVTKVECTNIDDKFQQSVCTLKSINRHKKVINLETRLVEKVTSCLLHLEASKRATKNVYRNLWFNYTADACQFMRNREKYPLFQLVYGVFEDFTNINHTCPYEGVVVLHNLPAEHKLLQIPLPSGEYLLKMNWIMNRQKRLIVSIWFSFEERI